MNARTTEDVLSGSGGRCVERLAFCAGVAVSAVVVGGCAVSGEAVGEGPVSQVPPPATQGALPWGADLHGFARVEARCDGDDDAIRMMWQGEHQFAVCRDGAGTRYLRAWTSAKPDPGNLSSDTGMMAVQGTFFTDTANSAQFVDGAAKFDIGPELVTVVWDRDPATGSQVSSTITTGPGWTRLN